MLTRKTRPIAIAAAIAFTFGIGAATYAVLDATRDSNQTVNNSTLPPSDSGPTMPMEPTISALPDGSQFGPATLEYFNRGTEVSSFLRKYDYPTTGGGTYKTDLAGVNDASNTYELKGEVVKPGEGLASGKELPEFFTGTAFDGRTFQYGQYSVYARFPVERDEDGNIKKQHKPVIILWPVDEAGDNWFKNVEVDIVEVFDPTRTTAELNVHYAQGDERASLGHTYPLDEQFHWYTIRWTPASFHIYVDGIELLNANGQPVVRPEAMPKGHHRMVFQNDQAGMVDIEKDPHEPRTLMEIGALSYSPLKTPES